MGQFKPMDKMETTEPSVMLKLKKGGKAVKKAIGGAMPPLSAVAPAMAAKMAAMKPRSASLMRANAPMKPNPGMPPQAMGKLKKGGEVESKAMEAKEEREIKSVKSELKKHEGMKASAAHKGLKTGGVMKKFATGGVVNKYADGGHCAMKSGGAPDFKANKKGGCW